MFHKNKVVEKLQGILKGFRLFLREGAQVLLVHERLSQEERGPTVKVTSRNLQLTSK
ncbi:hypothetical protein [Escherichia coli]|uniref:hypothetical protein n=1 Tax=Escherichia coli TaxID=562 RepID=UPI0013E052E2|nr:hypothetical protein [Escherichia coli]